jgi:hypothetical protein
MKKFFTSIFLLCSLASFSQSTTVVISQVYGGGGGTTGTYLYDYVELHNISSSAQLLTGFSLQYGSASGNFGSSASNIYAFPAGTSMPAGSYLLIQLSAAGTAGAALPVTADLVSSNLTMSGVSGKVVLANQATSLGCGATATTCTLPASAIIDLVSYGASNNAEGAVPVNNSVALTSTQGAVRKTNGCQDTDNNNNDFDVVTAPIPRNSASPINSCGPAGPALSITGTISSFGSVFIGSNSASQSYTLSGSNLTGAPGNITVTAPSTDFQVSNNNSTWGASTTIAYAAATLAATPVYIRFSPQSAGLKTGNVTNLGGGVATALNVAVTGTGVVVSTTPALSATTLASFGNVCVNQVGGPNSFSITGNNLTTGSITVGPLANFEFADAAGGFYTPSLAFSQTGGSFTAQVFVHFIPTVIQSYNGNIPVVGGGATAINVAASGAGTNSPATITTGAASSITFNSATISASIPSQGCTPVTAYGFQYSLTNGFTTGTAVSSTNLSGTTFSAGLSGLASATTYYYKAFATNFAGTVFGTQGSFTTSAPVLTVTPLTSFGSLCLNTVSAANSFTISSSGLNASNVTVGPLAGFSFATSQAGTYSPSLSISQPGGVFAQAVFVKFTPTMVQSYNGNIPVAGGGSGTVNVAVSGVGVNSAPAVTTGASQYLSANTYSLKGAVTTNGCSSVTEYGIEYSGISAFANGNGIRLKSTSATAADFSVAASDLVQATKYYFKAYAVNAGGIAYGNEQNFTTAAIPDGFTIYSSPVQRGGVLHYSLRGIQPGHYAAKIYNVAGQLVYQRELILQFLPISARVFTTCR